MSVRTVAAIAAGKLAGAASRAFGRGGGTALPGVIAERVDARLVEKLAAQLGHGSIVVTGTNGKTTTAHMLSSIAAKAGVPPAAQSKRIEPDARRRDGPARCRRRGGAPGRRRAAHRRLRGRRGDAARSRSRAQTASPALHESLPRSARPLRRGGFDCGALAHHAGRRATFDGGGAERRRPVGGGAAGIGARARGLLRRRRHLGRAPRSGARRRLALVRRLRQRVRVRGPFLRPRRSLALSRLRQDAAATRGPRNRPHVGPRRRHGADGRDAPGGHDAQAAS